MGAPVKCEQQKALYMIASKLESNLNAGFQCHLKVHFQRDEGTRIYTALLRCFLLNSATLEDGL